MQSDIIFQSIFTYISLGDIMANTWGRPPKNDIWNDLRALALWVFIVGIVGYLLFPDFFHNVYEHLTMPATTENESLGEITLPENDIDDYYYQLPSTYKAIYSGDSEISDGYWALFVVDNELKQMPLSPDSYTFILTVIDADTNAQIKNTLLLAANGSIRKYTVSDEIYDIISNLYKIKFRSGTI